MNVAKSEDELQGDPKGYFVLVQQRAEEEAQLDIREVLGRLWRGRWWVAAAIVLAGGIAAFDAFRTAPVYRSEALIVVRSDIESGGSLMRGQLGGLASLAGINLGGADRRNEFIAYLKSRELAQAFIESKDLMPVLFESLWDPKTKQLLPDEDGHVPVMRDGVDYILGLRKVSEEVKTGLITVSFDWVDPKAAAAWTNDYIAVANERLRNTAIEDARLSIRYLEEELSRVNVESVRQSLFRLMEGRINEVMLANVQHDFAFRTIDSAQPPDERRPIRPKRGLQILIGLALGAMLGAGFALWRYAPSHGRPATIRGRRFTDDARGGDDSSR